ncbi:MAG: PAS domain-containing protein [Rhodospirillaceae bacterium]
MTQQQHSGGKERFFGADDLIVSKTDLKGRITYANRLFMELADLDQAGCIGAPHNVVRHADMPRSVFHLLWDTIEKGQEIFAYVKNRSQNGDYYWVYAHVTPTFDSAGKIGGYHSTRRSPDRDVLQSKIFPLYEKLLIAERSAADRKNGQREGVALLTQILKAEGKSYDEYVLTL